MSKYDLKFDREKVKAEIPDENLLGLLESR